MQSQDTQQQQPLARRPKAFLPPPAIAACGSFRAAVRLAWESRASKHMTKRTLAEVCGLYAPHVTDYLHTQAEDEKGRKRLNLPAEKIEAFEEAVGNHVVSQFLLRRAGLTIMEEVIASRGL